MSAKGITSLATATAVVLSLGACKTIETQPSGAALPPIERPDEPVGTVWTWQTPDGTYTETLVAADGSVRRFESSDGCEWEQRADSPLGPSLRWRNCDLGDRISSGSQNVEEPAGALWPLTASSRSSWAFKGRDQRYDWESVRRCSVDGTVTLTVPAGRFTAYEVVCRDDWSQRTWYIAPEVGTVAFVWVRHGQGVVEDLRLVSREVPTA